MKRKHMRGVGIDFRGYTIVEALIFLAVSAGLLISVMTMISGQQERTQFNASVREFDNKLQDVLNDVQDGFYGSTGEACEINVSGIPQVDSDSTRAQGTNDQCTFLGKALRFASGDAPATVASEVYIYTIAGRRNDPTAGDKLSATTILQANPTVFGSPELYKIPYGIEVTALLHYPQGAAVSSTHGAAILGSIGGAGYSGGNETSGSSRTQVTSVGVSGFNAAEASYRTAVKNLRLGFTPDEGLVVCLRHGQGGRIAAIGLGVNLQADGTPKAYGQLGISEIFYDSDATKMGCPSS